MAIEYMALAALLGTASPEGLGNNYSGGLKQPLQEYSAMMYHRGGQAESRIGTLFGVGIDLPETASVGYTWKSTEQGRQPFSSIDVLGDGVSDDDLLIAPLGGDLGVCVTSLAPASNLYCFGTREAYAPRSVQAGEFYSSFAFESDFERSHMQAEADLQRSIDQHILGPDVRVTKPSVSEEVSLSDLGM